jgi:sec-independent protein translocase protein TatA
MSVGPVQLIIIALVILVLFGRGRISEMMGDFGKGIKSFKEGMNEEERAAAKSPPPQIAQSADSPQPTPAETREHS